MKTCVNSKELEVYLKEQDRLDDIDSAKEKRIESMYDELIEKGFIRHGEKINGKPYCLTVLDILGETTELENETVSNAITYLLIGDIKSFNIDCEGIVKRCLEAYL